MRKECLAVLKKAKKPLTTREIAKRAKLSIGTTTVQLKSLSDENKVKRKMIFDGNYYRFLWRKK